ncbi:MAG: AEC family transporter [Gammaproteobacteria bacterium]
MFPVVAPVFGAVALGAALVRGRLFDAATSDGLARFVYYVAIPALLFRSLARADLPDVLPWRLILSFYVPSIVMFGLGVALARHRFRWDRASQGIAGMGACYSNMVMLGLPLSHAAFGPAAAVPLFTLLALQSSILFTLATWTIEIYGAQGGRLPLHRALGRLVLNPVILCLLAGVLANVFDLAPTGALDGFLEKLAQAAPGCALVSLGASLAQYRIRGALGQAAGLLVIKNVLHPLAVWGACALLVVPVDWARVAVLLAAMPAGVNGYVFAKRYGLREEEISKTIVLSTLASSVAASIVLAHYL